MAATPRIDALLLNARAPERLAAFYVDALGMRASRSGAVISVAYQDPKGAQARIEFRPSPSARAYRPEPGDRYWKIGITLPDVDGAARRLRAQGYAVSAPEQFRDIGYLCHLRDPEGFQIELLQHSFVGAPRLQESDPAQPLGGARLGHITLRTVDIDRELALFRDRLGMRLLSRQPVQDIGFELYFLAFTEERPPHPDLTSVDNRPWLWRRPYTVLELQHRIKVGARVSEARPRETGYAGVAIGAEVFF